MLPPPGSISQLVLPENSGLVSFNARCSALDRPTHISRKVRGPEYILPPGRLDLVTVRTVGGVDAETGGGDIGESVVARITLARETYSVDWFSLNFPNL